MDLSSFFSSLAVCVAAASVVVSWLIYEINRKMGMRPVVVFTKSQPTPEDKEGWYICNVGNGPAINITLARQESSKNDEWVEYRQCPTLARGANFPIKLGGCVLQCDYTDIDGKWYSSQCNDWETSFPDERLPATNPENKQRLEGLPGTA